MSVMKISFEDLQITRDCFKKYNYKNYVFLTVFDSFLKNKKSEYGFTVITPSGLVDYKVIPIPQSILERILSYVDAREYPKLHKTLNSVYLSMLESSKESIFLYGGMKNE